MKNMVLVVAMICLQATAAFSQIKINEVQSSNSTTIKDPDYHDYADWIELYNTTSSSINIGGYYLTDNKDEPRKWKIPTGTTIAAKGYLLIWADDKFMDLHTNYKLSASGEKLMLYSNTMLFQDSVTFPEMETDFSYGRTIDGIGEWAILTSATPGNKNVATTLKGLAPKPNFSIKGGFYNSNQSVSLSTNLPGATIRYTTDGSEPTASSPVYSSPITAQKTNKVTLKYGYDRENDKTGIQKYNYPSLLSYPAGYYSGNRDFGYVIKAKVFHPDYAPSTTEGHTYFINMQKPSLPVISITTDRANLFDKDKGIYIQGKNGVSNGLVTANWYQDWERLVHVEYFDESGQRKIGFNAGASAMGAVSRSYDLKSLNIVMKNKYEKGEINYPLFGSDGLPSYESFVLRNSGNDWEQGVFARDAIIQTIVRGKIGIETQAYQPVILYINGEYWSLINMRERYDKRYFDGYYDYADKDNIDLLKINTDKKTFIASQGNLDYYNAMMAYINANDMSVQAHYDSVRTKYLDVDNMISYYIAQIYCQNTDWPENNTRMWRPQKENGRFRFPLYDTDFGYGNYGGSAYSNALSRVMSSSSSHSWSTTVFRKLMTNNDFKNEFIQRYAYMINTVYASSRLNSIASGIESKIASERALTDEEWTRSVNPGYNMSSLISWGNERISQAKSHLNSQFGSKGWKKLTVNFSASQGSVQLCNLPVEAGYSGDQYANTPIRLTATPKDGYSFSHWENGSGTSLSTEAEFKLTITDAYTVKAVFQSRSNHTTIKINEIMASNKTIHANEYGKYNDWIELYNSGSTPVDVAGLYISDNAANPTKYQIPYGDPDKTTIPPQGFIVLWANGTNYGGTLFLPFKLSKGGGDVVVSQKSSSGTVTVLDQLHYGSQNTDVSFGSYPNGSSNKIMFTLPTPGASNEVQSTAYINGLKITEFMAKNSSTVKEETGTYADWFEVHNTTSSPINMAGLFVTNSLSDLNMFMIPHGNPAKTTVPAGGYLVFWADKQEQIDANHVNFKLNAEKGAIAIVQLRSSENYIIDSVSYTNQGEDISYGRYPNVTSAFRYLLEPTPGAANKNTVTAAPINDITINEILALNTSTVKDNTGAYSDYIEIYNNSSSAINLGGLFISDSSSYSLRHRISRTDAAATTVQPKSWITLWADGKPEKGALHLDFSLDQLGESVVLSQVTENGIRIIDDILFGAQTANVSYGRYPETVNNWETMTPTYNAKNQSAKSSTALKSLASSAGTITPSVSATVYEYVCVLPTGTETVPTISASAVGAGAHCNIVQATSLEGSAKVTIISENQMYSKDYYVTFTIEPSANANLQSLVTSSGALSPAFNANTLNYTIALTNGQIPLLTAMPQNANSSVEVTYAQTTSGTTTIKVTAENNDVKTYTIAYNTSGGSSETIYSWYDSFDNNSTNAFSITGTSASYYTLSAANGEITVNQAPGKTEYRTFVYNLPAGLVLDMKNNDNPVLTFDVRSNKNIQIRIDLKDSDGKTGNDGLVTHSVTANEPTQLTYTYSSSKGANINKAKVVALVFYTDPDDIIESEKEFVIDNLTIGVPLSDNANLKTLTASAGTLSPTFHANTTVYTLTLPSSATTLPTITATKDHAQATVEISQPTNFADTAIIRVLAENKSTVKYYKVAIKRTPQVVQNYTDYMVYPALRGWTEQSTLYMLDYKGGSLDINYYRTPTDGNDAITYNIVDAHDKILNLTDYPYFSVRLKTTVPVNLRADLFDSNGRVTNASPSLVLVNGTSYVEYIFDFTGKFIQTSPSATVSASTISGVKLYFDYGSSSSKSGLVTIEKMIFGSDVNVPKNDPPVISSIPNQTIMQGQTFNNILLNNYVSDDNTLVTDLEWTVSPKPTNYTVTITNNVATIVVKDPDFTGAENITFFVQDEGGASASKQVQFTVTELKIPIVSAEFNNSSLTLTQNKTINLQQYLTIAPANATINSMQWSVASTNATINEEGALTNSLEWGAEAVIVTVVITDKNSNEYTKTITVNLEGCPTKVSTVSLQPATLHITEGDTLRLSYTYTPDTACVRTVSYTIADTAIATVSKSGVITGKTPGTTTVTIFVNDGYSNKTAVRTVTIKKDCSGPFQIAIAPKTLEVAIDGQSSLTASFIPNNECTESKSITWKSLNSSIATVSAAGVLTARELGEVFIVALSEGVTDTSVVTVVPNCYYKQPTVTLNKHAAEFYTDEQLSVVATITPQDVCNDSLVWISRNNSIAQVDNLGNITPTAPGVTYIVCSSVQEPAGVDSVKITVLERVPTSLSIRNALSISVDETRQIQPTILPPSVYNSAVTWVSWNTAIATVNALGEVTGIGVGTTSVTATTHNGLRDTCIITVNPVEATSIKLSLESHTMYVYDSIQLSAAFTPTNTTDTSLVWTSSDPAIASVVHGKVKAIKAGTIVVTAYTTNGKIASCEVEVRNILPEQIATSLQGNIERFIGDEDKIKVSFFPEKTTDTTITWTSSDTSVVSVSKAGDIVALREGIAIITATTSNDKEASVIITVLPIDVENIELNIASSILTAGDKQQLMATLTPENVTNKTLEWKSSNEAVAIVSPLGLVSALAVGEAIITVTSHNGLEAYCNVEVQELIIDVQSIGIDIHVADLLLGETLTLVAEILPEDATNKSITWKSLNTDIAAVNQNGKVTALAVGSAKIVVSSINGLTDTCVVEVKHQPITSIELKTSDIAVAKGATISIANYLEINPANAHKKSVEWSVNNEFASITEQGVLTNTLEWGSVQADVFVSVTDAYNTVFVDTVHIELIGCPTKIDSYVISPSTSSLVEGDTLNISTIISPATACVQSVEYASSNPSVLSVSNAGVLYAHSPGIATLTVSISDGFEIHTKTKEYTVLKDCSAPITLELSHATLHVPEGGTATITSTVVPDNECTENVIVEWKSSDNSIVTVINGELTALNEGAAVVTAFVDSDTTIRATCTVNVVKHCEATITSLSVNTTEVQLYMNQTAQIQAELLPANACNPKVLWKSLKETVAVVNASGKITPVGYGTAKIIAWSEQSPTKEVEINVTIEKRLPTSIEILSSASMFKDSMLTLLPQLRPSNIDDASVAWRSSDTSIAVVNSVGEVFAKSGGDAYIYATTVNGLKDSCKITVKIVPVADVVIDASLPSSISVYDTIALRASVLPAHASYPEITWQSSNPSIAKIVNGTLVGVSAGSVTVRATAHGGVIDEVTIEIKGINISTLNLSAPSSTMNVNTSQQIASSYTPANATNIGLTWSSDNENSISVNQNGQITAMNPGSATIKATTSNGVVGSISITVNNIMAESLQLNTNSVVLKVSENQTLSAEVLPANTTNKLITWESSDPTTVTVDANGKLTAKTIGIATVTASTDNGKIATCTVNVVAYTIPVESVVLNYKTYSLFVGDSIKITASAFPESASNKSISWSTDKTSIATVSNSGLVVGKDVGIARITASSINGVVDTCVVTVKPIPAESVRISPSIVNLTVGEQTQINVTFTPQNATYKFLTWTIDTAIATISSAGLLTARSVGVTTLKVKSYDGKEDAIQVKIASDIIYVEEILLPDTITVNIDEELELSPSFLPVTANRTSLTWKIQNSSIASVNAGKLKGLVAGRTTLTATTENAKQKTVTVVVNPLPVSYVAIVPQQLDMTINQTHQLEVQVLPIKSTDKSITWESKNTSVVTVVNGLLTSHAIGQAVVRAISSNGVVGECVVTVVPVVAKSISIDQEPIELMVTQTAQLSAGITPSNVTNATVLWRSANDAIASVSEDGQIEAQGVGTTYIIAATSNGLKDSIKIVVSVLNYPPSVSSIPEQIINRGEMFPVINLNDYFTDDNTPAEELLWAANASGVVAMNIKSSGTASVFVTEPNWTGTETITVYCTDKYGAQSSLDISFTVLPPVSITMVEQTITTVYPNPTTDYVTVRVQAPISELYSIAILSSSGTLIDRQIVQINSQEEITFNVSQLPKGMYIIEVTSSESKYSTQLIIN